MAPCLPGASIEGKDGDVYTGAMRTKVGPIVASYRGTLKFDELDKEKRRAVISARAEEVSGQGGAEAQIVTSVIEGEDGSLVVIETDVQIRGRVAQFGRGALEKISQKMFADFAKNLERQLSGESEAAPEEAAREGGGAREATAAPPSPTAADGTAEQASLDVLGLVGEQIGPLARRVGAPLLVGLVVGFVVGRSGRRGERGPG
ncbi:MAG: SRPBCC family protein [Actinobacteria bacterium]|nr:SRPBCC family protein [Actinomycetota bacterium]